MNEKKVSWLSSVVYIGLTLVLIFSFTAINASMFTPPGISYEKEIYAFPDPIMVRVTINNGKFTGGKIISQSESARAFPGVTAILAQAVQNGDANNLDAVSGVTASSNAAIETLQVLMASTSGISYEREIYAVPDPITVRVTIKDDKFTGGEIISASESALAFPAVTAILAQAVENGNADDLDMVSGATASSTAAIKTLKELMANEGL